MLTIWVRSATTVKESPKRSKWSWDDIPEMTDMLFKHIYMTYTSAEYQMFHV